MIDIKTATKEELIKEYEKCEKEWGKWSCDSFGYYIENLRKRIAELGGFTKKNDVICRKFYNDEII